ncbi:hypothetical protein [Aquimarina sp. RZ0]|uniref:hypothetical protein n=1 Tax=Aquimarina sp. RZ0 TaxID=2607730 RepID=UPI0011F255AD|nr:hypothetical protein [Aquimarina sp. RZ0]KAA1246611.1 hypothetical protein F0000_06915 [Aquimarina sp. RZ0]
MRIPLLKRNLENTIEDEFTYELIASIIKLTPNWDDSTVTEFEIENRYPNISKNPTIYYDF